MTTEPSPPSPGSPGSPPTHGTTVRPGPVIAAGIVLIALGPLSALWGIIAVSGRGDPGNMIGALGGAVSTVGIIMLALGTLEVWTGVKVLGLSNTWRIVGLALATIVTSLNLIGLIGGEDVVANLGGVAIGGFLIWALVKCAPAFNR